MTSNYEFLLNCLCDARITVAYPVVSTEVLDLELVDAMIERHHCMALVHRLRLQESNKTGIQLYHFIGSYASSLIHNAKCIYLL